MSTPVELLAQWRRQTMPKRTEYMRARIALIRFAEWRLSPSPTSERKHQLAQRHLGRR